VGKSSVLWWKLYTFLTSNEGSLQISQPSMLDPEAPFAFIEADPVFAVMYSSGCMQLWPHVKFVPTIVCLLMRHLIMGAYVHMDIVRCTPGTSALYSNSI
jgi:hypothetical protein